MIAIGLCLPWLFGLGTSPKLGSDHGPQHRPEPAAAPPRPHVSNADSSGPRERPDALVGTSAGVRVAPAVEIVGRVLDTRERPVAGVRLFCRNEAQVDAAPLVADADPNGHFRFEVPAGVYQVYARAPGHCMLPVKTRTVAAGGEPVRIYMGTMARLTLQVLDRFSRSEIALPYESKAVVLVDGQEVPADSGVDVATEVWSDQPVDTSRSVGRQLVRVLGREIADAVREDSLVEVRMSSPGLQIEPGRITIAEATSGAGTLTLLANALDGWRLGRLTAAYDSGDPLEAPLIATARLATGEKLHYWGLENSRAALLALRPGDAALEVGLISIAMQTVSLKIPDEPYPAVVLTLVRGGDLSISMQNPETGRRCGFGDVEIDAER
ncbi:MAG: carboxypeptidase-like regulatory domain-containing protein, partial [Planctomycetes bacterium]|nr:carboxypeptidase-like regulatory domain-containing protein [Planctomycetota bacterium]